MKKSQNRSPIVFYFAIAVMILLVITTNVTGGLFARYASYSEGEDSARVIKFGDITLTTTIDNFLIVPGRDIAKTAKISFAGSESATYLFVVLDVGEAWSFSAGSMFSVTLDSVTAMQWSVVTTDWTYLTTQEGKYVFYKTLAPNVSLANVEVVSGAKITVSNDITNTMLNLLAENKEKLSISISATVVQSNGFDDVSTAWTSVAGA